MSKAPKRIYETAEDFFLYASDEEKKEVFTEVAKEAGRLQLEMLKKPKKSDE